MNSIHSRMKTKFILLFTITVISCASVIDLPHLIQPKYFDNDTVQWFPEIVSGTPVQLDQMNGVVSIQNRYGHHLCSGTLVSYKFVLTAASCLVNQNGNLLDTSEIRVIADDIVIVGDGSATRQIGEIKMYYTRSNSGMTLIELLNPFIETSTLTYKEISNYTVNYDQICQLIGWGSLSSNNEVLLQQINVKVMSNEVANSAKYFNSSMPANVIAVSAVQENSSCFGDLGSALVCDGNVNGILSFGYGCSRSHFPIIFYNTYDDDLITDNRERIEAKRGGSKPSVSRPGIKYPGSGATSGSNNKNRTCEYNQYGEWVCSGAATTKLFSITSILFIIFQSVFNKLIK